MNQLFAGDLSTVYSKGARVSTKIARFTMRHDWTIMISVKFGL